MFNIPIPWTDLVVRTVREFRADNGLGLAAQVTYYLLFALVPALVFLVSLTSFFPPAVLGQMLASLAVVAPAEVMAVLREQTQAIAARQRGGLLTFGFVAALWSSSAAVVAITDALNRAYDIQEARPWWKVRLMAIGVTLALSLLILIAFNAILFGPTAAEWLGTASGTGVLLEWSWRILQWPIAFSLVVLGLACLNYFGPDAEQDWAWVTPGAVLATALWLLASIGFKVYLANFADYNATYGSLGGVMVLMLWLYVSSVAILIGAEMNAEIEHASPWGKAPGEKVADERRRVGARARRTLSQESGAALS